MDNEEWAEQKRKERLADSVEQIKREIEKHKKSPLYRTGKAPTVVAPTVVNKKPSTPTPTQSYQSVFAVQEHTFEYLQEYKNYLERELDETWRLLRFAWKTEHPPNIEKRPWKSDVRVACRSCGKSTLWRHGKGWAECFPECKVVVERVKTTPGIPGEVWKILLDEEVD